MGSQQLEWLDQRGFGNVEDTEIQPPYPRITPICVPLPEEIVYFSWGKIASLFPGKYKIVPHVPPFVVAWPGIRIPVSTVYQVSS